MHNPNCQPGSANCGDFHAMTRHGTASKHDRDDESDTEGYASKRLKPEEKIDRDSDALKHPQFERWLKSEKDKHLDELDKDDRGHYARKFRGRWNRGKLSSRYYDTSTLQPGTKSSSSRYEMNRGESTTSRTAMERLQLQREQEAEERDLQRQDAAWHRKRDRREERAEQKDQQSVGKERLMEKKMEARASNQAFASRKDETDMSFSENFLGLDDEDSFAKAKAARDKSKKPSAKQLR